MTYCVTETAFTGNGQSNIGILAAWFAVSRQAEMQSVTSPCRRLQDTCLPLDSDRSGMLALQSFPTPTRFATKDAVTAATSSAMALQRR
ncbi:hypothetical protein V8C44DRAFT_309372 [Trichoderma aethiopicum]